MQKSSDADRSIEPNTLMAFRATRRRWCFAIRFVIVFDQFLSTDRFLTQRRKRETNYLSIYPVERKLFQRYDALANLPFARSNLCFPFFTDRRCTLLFRIGLRSRFRASGDLERSEEKKTFCMRFDSYDRIHARPYYERVRKIRKRLILQARLKITVKRMHFGR